MKGKPPLEPERRVVAPLRHLRLYLCAEKIYIVGFSNERGGPTKFLRIDRAQGDKLSLRHDCKTAGAETDKWLEKIERIETPESVMRIYGILGLQKIVDSWYLYVIVKGHKVGQLRGSYVYSLERYAMIRVCSRSRAGADEVRFKSLVEKNLDLTKEFYFSYGYDLTHTMQANSRLLRTTPVGGTYPASDMFVWNTFLMRPLVKWLSSPSSQAMADDWLLPVVHGYFRQRAVELSTGQVLRLTLIGRRSRHFAGTRLLKRGVNARGFVANEVETEQVVSLDPSLGQPSEAYCAVVQVRGSIPLFWSHINMLAPKPDIVLSEVDPFFQATRRHFDRLFSRYGRHAALLNLVKQMEKKPKESALATRFAEAVGFLNARYEQEDQQQDGKQQPLASSTPPVEGGRRSPSEGQQEEEDEARSPPLQYISYDFLANQKRSEDGKGTEVFDALMQIADTLLPTVGLFVDPGTDPPPPWSRGMQEQCGVLRTNCIDCMDRTNIGQFCFGRVALDHQLEQLGLSLPPPSLSDVAKVLMELWADHGDRIANQYGGSGAMHKVEEAEGSVAGQRELILTGGAKNALVAVQRYVANNVTDYERQQAMDLFLGVSVPTKGSKPGAAWELLPPPPPPPPPPLTPTEAGKPPGPLTPSALASKPSTVGDEVDMSLSRPGAGAGVDVSVSSILTSSGDVEAEEVLLLPRRVCRLAGRFPHDSHYGGKLSSFDKMGTYEFDVPVLKGLAFDFFHQPPPPLTTPRHATGPTATATTTPPSQPAADASAALYRGHKKRLRHRTAAEALYEKYLAFEVTLRTPTVPPADAHSHHSHYYVTSSAAGQPRTAEALGEYVSAAKEAVSRCDVALRAAARKPERPGLRRTRSLDDFLSVGRRAAAVHQREARAAMAMTCFDDGLVADGRRREEGEAGPGSRPEPISVVGRQPSEAPRGPSKATPTPTPVGGEGWDKGLQKLGKLFSRLAPGTTEGAGSGTGSAVGSKPGSKSGTPVGAEAVGGEGAGKKADAQQQPLLVVLPPPPSLPQAEEVQKMVEEAVRGAVEEGERERAREVKALREALRAVQRQQAALMRLWHEQQGGGE